jgi:phosphoglycerate dehydrogenase-like enzyme
MSKTVQVLITIAFPESLVSPLKGISPRLNITVQGAQKVEEIPPDLWAQTEVLYTDRIIPAPEQAPNLHWVQLHWAGADHALDLPIIQKADLILTNLSGASASQVAEFALTMMLALGHHLPALAANQSRGDWPRDRWNRFTPQELRNSTLGIVGYGSIGRQAARLLHTFGTTILAAKRDAMHPEDTGYIPEGLGDPNGDLVNRLYPSQALRSMLKECDYVLVTVPLTRDTRGLIGAAELAAMKPSAYLIDVSRGGVVDQAALAAALRDKKIAGAALDVFPDEPLPPDSPLWKLPNVIVSPHVSGYSRHYDERAMALFAENLHRYLADLPLYNQVNLERGY